MLSNVEMDNNEVLKQRYVIIMHDLYLNQFIICLYYLDFLQKLSVLHND